MATNRPVARLNFRGVRNTRKIWGGASHPPHPPPLATGLATNIFSYKQDAMKLLLIVRENEIKAWQNGGLR